MEVKEVEIQGDTAVRVIEAMGNRRWGLFSQGQTWYLVGYLPHLPGEEFWRVK